MTLEKPYLRQTGLFEVGKFAKKPYFHSFAVVLKEPHPSRIARGTKLTFHLAISDRFIEDPVQTMIWNGWPESVLFIVDIPLNYERSNVVGKLTISQNSIPVGHITFILKVSEHMKDSKWYQRIPVGDEARRYSYAFISYASGDRDKVLARVQMLEQVGIEYFQDLLSLAPGARWEKEIYKNIDRCDLFLLFWSQQAKESEWVMKEVDYALARKGDDEDAPPEIKPVVIEGPPIAAPPDKLKHLHFNDRVLNILRFPPAPTKPEMIAHLSEKETDKASKATLLIAIILIEEAFKCHVAVQDIFSKDNVHASHCDSAVENLEEARKHLLNIHRLPNVESIYIELPEPALLYLLHDSRVWTKLV